MIDVLARVSREKRVVDGDPEGLREQVLELCLEYIGRRWRCGEKGEEDIVTGIARKLTEITFEVGLKLLVNRHSITHDSFNYKVILPPLERSSSLSSTHSDSPSAWSRPTSSSLA